MKGQIISKLNAIIFRIGMIKRYMKWYAVDGPRYIKSAFLKAPQASDYESEIFGMLEEYYEQGITVVGKTSLNEPDTSFAIEVQNLFKNSIEKYNASPLEDEYVKYFDKNGCLWVYNTVEGIIHLQLADPTHSLYSKMVGNLYAGDGDIPPYTIQDAYREYPHLQEIVQHSSLLKLANYANDGDTTPIVIKIERKIHTCRDDKYNERYVHIDTVNTSTFKGYVYLNDVDETNGPIAVSRESHHWKLYPELLKTLLYSGAKHFSPEQVSRFDIHPIQPLCGKAGTLFGFSGNLVHNATNMEKGKERWTVQIYYYSDHEWSTERK